MRHALAPALLLIIAIFPLPSGSEPLYETPAILTCPECSPINAAIQVADGIVAVGQRGLILRSTTDGGWEQQHAPVRRTLNAVIHTGDDRLIAVGQDALVISRDSPGASWTLIQADPTLDAPLLDLWIGNEGRGFAVGAYGLALVTDDGGRNWSERKIDAQEPHFYAIREAPEGTLYICGEYGTVLQSRNRGASWTPLSLDWDGTFFGCRAGHEGRILVYGLEGMILESRDQGASWRRLETGSSASIYDATFLADGRAVVVGAGGTVLIETATGEFEHIAHPHRGSLTAVLARDAHTLVLFGEGGVHTLALADSPHFGIRHEP